MHQLFCFLGRGSFLCFLIDVALDLFLIFCALINIPGISAFIVYFTPQHGIAIQFKIWLWLDDIIFEVLKIALHARMKGETIGNSAFDNFDGIGLCDFIVWITVNLFSKFPNRCVLVGIDVDGGGHGGNRDAA